MVDAAMSILDELIKRGRVHEDEAFEDYYVVCTARDEGLRQRVRTLGELRHPDGTGFRRALERAGLYDWHR